MWRTVIWHWHAVQRDGRTEDEEKETDTVGDERREEPTPCLTSSASPIGSTDHEYDDSESSQSNRPSGE
ncbi:hypothetical protein AVEN_201226-1 [Araneus ventricosus]|uniref:Uncharacterized protein n=1 Tax=Araneus ventricosus TaxID=182803 RepID=A0A4Y2BFY2_ARAVE|nr:hypothetical protein AVEN_201226-1 [Araneus ventricosus]